MSRSRVLIVEVLASCLHGRAGQNLLEDWMWIVRERSPDYGA